MGHPASRCHRRPRRTVVAPAVPWATANGSGATGSTELNPSGLLNPEFCAYNGGATTGWLETYAVPHGTARNTVLGLEKQVLWRHSSAERTEPDSRTHFWNLLIDALAKEHGIEWVPVPIHKTNFQASSLPDNRSLQGAVSWSSGDKLSEGGAVGNGFDFVSPNFSLSFPPVIVPHAYWQQMSNSSSITQFLLLAFTDTWEQQLLHFWFFLGIYLAALLGNGLIITTIACDQHLHTPMYFFLLNLSLLDLGSISTILPKSLANSLWDTRCISFLECAAQVFMFLFFMAAEYFLLTVMCYDRYIAICKPLHYRTLLGSRACVHMAAAAWATGFLTALLHTANTFSLPLCKGNALDQFFCEIPQILKLCCQDFYLRELGLLVVSACLAFVCFVFIVLSYVQILRSVLRIPSEQGRHKAFSTCLPHLAVVSLYVSTAIFAHLKPPSISSPILDLLVSVLYSVVPPAVNPLIYSMRNQELKDALRKLLEYSLLQVKKVRVISLGLQ
ncbi:olfactory receptor 14J1-like [Caloenas nicobarica]|uniref:olfactory receptor 14J1-like n=1 Tax=Caloenas nicobarica TaxID=187106 RepID=UPI0032B789AF